MIKGVIGSDKSFSNRIKQSPFLPTAHNGINIELGRTAKIN